MVKNKIKHGQFYTVGNCFTHPAFREWIKNIPNLKALKVIEPFGGANNIIKLVSEANLGVKETQWVSYDIEPEAVRTNSVPNVPLIQRDTLNDFPDGFDVCITNPPYLAKNSATRKNFVLDFKGYSDLYLTALETILEHTAYVAVIIPETFLTQKIFTDRLVTVVSLNSKMFDDTEFPVCLALFNPTRSPDFNVWVGETLVGGFNEIEQKSVSFLGCVRDREIKFNEPTGELGLYSVDNTQTASIKFLRGENIPSNRVKKTHRMITRISLPVELTNEELDTVISEANKVLNIWRSETSDVLMSAFNGLRKDGVYRRKLSFQTANLILVKVLTDLGYYQKVCLF